MEKQLNRHAYTALAGGMFISGSAIVAGKILAGELPAFLSAEMGLLCGLAVLLPLTFLKRKETVRLDGRSLIILLLQAACGIFLYRIFTFWGLKYTTAADSGLITSATPAVIALFAAIFLREKLSRNRIIGVICVVAGLTVINLHAFLSNTAGGTEQWKGNLLILAAVVCEALFSILSKARVTEMSPLMRTSLLSLFASIYLIPFTLWDMLHFTAPGISPSALACILYYGVFVSALSYILWFKGIAAVSAGNAAVFTGVVPLSSILLSAVVLKEQILPVHLIGLGLILLGIYVSCIEPGTKIFSAAKTLVQHSTRVDE